jgi:glyoxylase-like metal-dependent hydrolase (beta-lactamase superfamily II)
MGSLTKVRRLPDLRLLPAHGPVAPSSHARVDELLAHHEDRLDRCLEILRGAEEATAYEVARSLPWTRHERSLDDLDEFNGALASMETKAHLELLVAQARVTADAGGGPVRYAGRGAPA